MTNLILKFGFFLWLTPLHAISQIQGRLNWLSICSVPIIYLKVIKLVRLFGIKAINQFNKCLTLILKQIQPARKPISM